MRTTYLNEARCSPKVQTAGRSPFLEDLSLRKEEGWKQSKRSHHPSPYPYESWAAPSCNGLPKAGGNMLFKVSPKEGFAPVCPVEAEHD